MVDTGLQQNNIKDLPILSDFRYENIFKVYTNADNQYFYNILNTVSFPKKLDQNLFSIITVNEKTPWTVISFNAYNTIELWWLIALINDIRNPFELPVNRKLKILKPEYINAVLSQINQLLK